LLEIREEFRGGKAVSEKNNTDELKRQKAEVSVTRGRSHRGRS